MNLQKATNPRFENVERSVTEPVEMLGDSGYLAVSVQTKLRPVDLQGKSVQVVDTTDGSHLVVTVEGVTRTAELSDTGTTFLLGSQGLTVVRRLSAEEQHATEEMAASHN